MSDPRSVDQDIGVFDRTQIWMNLRLLHGLDLDEFLVKLAARLPCCGGINARRQMGRGRAARRPRVPRGDAGARAADRRAAVRSVETTRSDRLGKSYATRGCSSMQDQKIAKGTAHLNVRFSALQGITLHDLQNGHTRMAPRLQESTWTFEGVVRGDQERRAVWRLRRRRRRARRWCATGG